MSDQQSIEVWRDVQGYPGWQVSDQGNVRTFRKQKPPLKWEEHRTLRKEPKTPKYTVHRSADNTPAYFMVSLRNEKGPRLIFLHTLVLRNFVGPCPEGMECRHKDGDSFNARLDNLEWGTKQENADDRVRHGTSNNKKAVKCKDLTDVVVRDMKERLSGKFVEDLTEHWVEIAGCEGVEVSDKGRVRTFRKQQRKRRWEDHKNKLAWPRLLKLSVMKSSEKAPPYYVAGLPRTDKRVARTIQVHRLVIEAFVGPCPEGQECRHLNGNSLDNKLSNLQWGTRQENIDDRGRHGNNVRGERHGRAKLTEEKVRQIKRWLREGMEHKEIAERSGVKRSAISMIAIGKNWSHVTES